MPENAKVLVLVAHPDDETLWAGGTLLMQRGWAMFVVTLCRGGDEDRAPRFFRVLDLLGAKGAMAKLDDGPEQNPLDEGAVRRSLLSLVPRENFDLILTHSPRGEYTRHLRHEEVSRSVLRMWARGEMESNELWLFAYDDENGRRWPSAEPNADVIVELSDNVWAFKRSLLTRIYGFSPDSWEVQTNPRREAFWRLRVPNDVWTHLKRGGTRQ